MAAENLKAEADLDRNANTLSAADKSCYAHILEQSDFDNVVDEWRELASRTIEPNPYFEPTYLLASCRHLKNDKENNLIAVRSKHHSGRLVGLFPIQREWLSKGFYRPVTAIAGDILIGIYTPLIDQDCAEDVWKAFLDFVFENPKLPSTIYIPELYRDGPAKQALERLVRHSKVSAHIFGEYERPVAHRGETFASYQTKWSKKKARNIRSRTKKLKERGDLTFQFVRNDDADFELMFEKMLQLEARGWKGEQGTALASNPNTLAFAHAAFNAKDGSSNTVLPIMMLDGEVIAAQLNIVSGKRMFFLRSGYDETLSNLGPGVILYAWVLEQFLESNHWSVLDTSADPGHPLGEIYNERENVESVLLGRRLSEQHPELKRLEYIRAQLRAFKAKLMALSEKKKSVN